MPWRILAIGHSATTLPDHPEIAWSREPARSCDGIALFDGALPPQGVSPLLPLAAFGAVASVTRDFAPDFVAAQVSTEALDAMLVAFAQIHERGSWDISQSRASLDLTILRLSHSRAQPLEALRSPQTVSTLLYPLLHGRAGIDDTQLRPALERLAGLDLLERRFAARLLACPKCSSARTAGFEACTACGSANLMEEPILHHYRCGFQDGESRFLHGLDLICPKCNQELRHFGVDYGRPGSMLRCRACQQVMNEPQPSFHCLDCQTVSRGDEVVPVDCYHYRLTERGIAAAQSGVLPAHIGAEAEAAFPRTFTLKAFDLLVREQALVARRYDRPMAVGRIRIGNLAALRQQQDPSGNGPGSSTIRLFSQILVESLRETDFVAVPRDGLILVAMPETDIAQAHIVFDRIRTAATRHLAAAVTLDCEAVPAAQSTELLDALAS